MAVEIERKFLVVGNDWKHSVGRETVMEQGYLGGDQCSIRVRVEGDSARLNIKSLSTGIRRTEFEYPIPLTEAQQMLADFATSSVSKTRHYVDFGRHQWEIDVFAGANQGLIVAEIELSAEDESFERPPWLGEEVSQDPRYLNVFLARKPFTQW